MSPIIQLFASTSLEQISANNSGSWQPTQMILICGSWRENIWFAFQNTPVCEHIYALSIIMENKAWQC
jgi:hypothetical protein